MFRHIKDMTSDERISLISKLEKLLVVLAVIVIVSIGLVGFLQGLKENMPGAVVAILAIMFFGDKIRLENRVDKLRERLLNSELNAAMEDASTPTEIDANCKEIEHKIDVGYYQGR